MSATFASPTHSLLTRTRGAERASSWSPLISTRKKCRPTPCRRTIRARTGGRPSLPRPVKARRPARAPASLVASRRPPPGPARPVRFWPPSCCCPRTITPRSSRFRNRPRWTLTLTPPRPMSPGPSRPSLKPRCALPLTLQTRRCRPRHRRRTHPASASPVRGPSPTPPPPPCRRPPARTSRRSLSRHQA